MATTGYTDTFGRTVSNGLGSATSGQAYTLFGAASQFSVAPNVATIAISSAGDKFGFIDALTSDLDITGQVALTAIPATNLATVGFIGRLSSTANYYNATMMVAAGGAVSLRFSKVVGGGLVTIATVATGLTYVANTFYNLRWAIRWSQALQTNILQSMLWVVGGTPPGGWMATATDNALGFYVAGTNIGIMARDESTVVGSVSAKIQNVAQRSYNLPIPATTDPMCYDPAFAYPKQEALESLADAVDVAMAGLDPLVSLAGLFPRVRISASSVPINTAGFNLVTFAAIEFNLGTPTDLGLDNQNISLPVGVWLVTFEMQLADAASDFIWVTINGGSINANIVDMRSNPAHAGDGGVGGTVHMSVPVIVTDPTTPQKCSVSLTPNNSATTYTITYMALSAVKISDYFV
jgi:hypothetical protein